MLVLWYGCYIIVCIHFVVVRIGFCWVCVEKKRCFNGDFCWRRIFSRWIFGVVGVGNLCIYDGNGFCECKESFVVDGVGNG